MPLRLVVCLITGGVPDYWRSSVIVPLYEGERIEYKNYRGISLLNVVGKYEGILVDRVRLIDDEQEVFRAGGGGGYVDQNFTLKQICEKAREKT